MSDEPPFKIEKIAVIGGGEMGHGVAELAAVSGFDVTIRDIDEEILEDSLEKIEWSLEKLREKGFVSEEERKRAIGRISVTTDMAEAVGDADAIIEAVPENVDLKQRVFREMEELSPDHALLATNTSGIPITTIGELTENPDKVIGMHFFNPVMLMNLIEIIRGEETSDESVAAAEWLSEQFGKEYVVVRKDVPGFITSRVIGPYMIEAGWQLHEGKGTMEEIDSACKYRLGFPMGPFELLDLTGLDIPVEGREGGTFEMEISPPHIERFEKGELGRKTGKGWHDWTEEGKGCTASPDQADVYDPLPVIAPTINEAARLIHQDVADPEEIDLAMRLGTAYPKGPCKLGDEIGLDKVLESLRENPRVEPSELLVEMVKEGKTGKEAGEGFYS